MSRNFNFFSFKNFSRRKFDPRSKNLTSMMKSPDEFKVIHKEEITPLKSDDYNRNLDKIKYGFLKESSLKKSKMFGYYDRDNVLNKKRLKR